MTFFNAEGTPYTTDDPNEITRLQTSRHHFPSPPEKPGDVGGAVAQQQHDVEAAQFHPADHGVAEVLDYVEKNPAEGARILAEEKAGAGRVTILGKLAP